VTSRLASSRRLRILRAIAREGEATNATVRDHLDLGDDRSNRVSCELRILRSRGWVERVSGGQGSTITRYRVTDAGIRTLAAREGK
jgi:DNA-binding MarR family transcriptional regulator